MKQKISDCVDCDKKNVPVTAKRCQSCYWKHRSKVNKEKKEQRAKEKGEKLYRIGNQLLDQEQVQKRLQKDKEAKKRQNKKRGQSIKEFDKLFAEKKKKDPQMSCINCGLRVPETGMSLSHTISAQVIPQAYHDVENVEWACPPSYGCGCHGVWHSSKRFTLDCYEYLMERSEYIKAKYLNKD